MLSAQELIIGPAFLSADGLDMGFTTTDGITYTPEHELTEFEAAQTQMIADAHRSKVRGVVAATFNQLSLEKWALLEDIDGYVSGNTLVGKWKKCGPTKRNLVLTMPGPNCGVRTMSAMAVLLTPGEKVFSNNEYTGAPVEFLLLGDPATETLWTIVETPAGGDAPAAASFQHVAANGTETSFVDGAVNVADDATAIQITFNVDIRLDQLNSSKFILKEQTGNIVLATYAFGTTTGNPDYKKVKVIPTSGLSASTDYDLIIVPGVVSMSGKASSGASIQFSTTA